jgi:hypothetical protein
LILRRTLKGARMTDRIAGMLTIAIDAPDLAVPALAAIVRTGKARKCRPQMIYQTGSDRVPVPPMPLNLQGGCRVEKVAVSSR